MEHFLKVDGIIAAQTSKVESAFRSILKEFDLIVEIGFSRGAFSLWLHRNKRVDTKLVSYDITFASKEVDNSDIDFRQGDCFDDIVINEIKSLIELSGRVLVLCDGGYKEREFNLYSKFLKPEDVIMLHDYAHSDSQYNQICLELGWQTEAESRFDNIQDAIKINKLTPYKYDAFKDVLWGSFSKQR